MLTMTLTNRALTVALALFIASPVLAQTSTTDAQLRLVIVDQTGAVIPAATVTVKQAAGEPVVFVSDEHGVATSALTPGAATVQVEFPGFLPFEAPLTLRRGATNETVTLEIEGFTQEVTVTASATEASNTASTTTLSQEEIDALPDDPEELAEALSAMAGPGGASFMMNGFSGGRLPSRDQIRSIRIRQNNYAADNHDAGRAQIEIITRPNTSWGGNATANFGGDMFNARQPQQTVETPSQERTMQFGVRGPLVAGKTSFNFNVNNNSRYNSNPIIAIDEFGGRITDSVRATNGQSGFAAGLEHTLTANQSLLLNFQRSENEGLNQGVGGFNLPERASTRLNDSNQFRARVQSVIGKTRLNELRVQVTRSTSEAFSLSSAPTLVVQDAFTRGGAGVNSRSATNRFEIADNFDFSVGRRHQMRVGVLVEGAYLSNFDERNAAGTWTYRTVEDFLANRPQQFSQRLGTVDTSFSQYQAGFYWSDEYRLHRDLTLGFGVRNEIQSRIDDALNLMPRIGFTWAPFGSQTSAIRGGYGIFYDWYETGLYDQTLRVDGVTVRDIRVSCLEDNGFCADVDALDPTSAAVRMTAGGRIQASEDLSMPRVHQASIGYDRQLTPAITLQTSYQMLRGENQMRSRNVNAPVDGIRPNPAFGDITQFESTGRSESDRLTIGTRFRLATTAAQQPLMFNVNYTLGREKNFADSATSLPSNSLNPDLDWGPSRGDIRHRVQLQANVPMLFGVRGNFNLNVASGVPYNMTTGIDNNDDGVFNDRPEGVERNSLRGDATWGLNLNLSKRFTLGAAPTPVTRQAAQQQRGFGGPGAGAGQGAQGGRTSSVELFVQAQNILNHVTKTGYTGNLSSPFFGTATSVGAPRDINVGLRFNF
jgi:hypothetical protein